MPPEGYDERNRKDLFSYWGLPFYSMNYPDGSGIETRTKAFVQAELEAALEVEDYEQAVVLRDELKAMSDIEFA